MHTRNIRRRPATIAAVAILAIGAFAGVAIAVPSTSGGTAQLRMDNRGETAVFSTAAVAWQNLPNSDVSVTVPDGQSRLVNARFTAGSTCFGPVGQWCRVRIVAVDANGVVTELDPVDGVNFHFDSAAPGAGNVDREGHAMERSRRLHTGTYTVGVQYSVSNANTTSTLGRWHHAVETTA